LTVNDGLTPWGLGGVVSQTGLRNIEIERSDSGEGLPPHVESYKKAGSKVALRVSVEKLGVAWRVTPSS